MVKCDNCGEENSSDAVRCKKCGKSFDSKKGGLSNTKIIAIVAIIVVIAIVGVFASGILTKAPAQNDAQAVAPQQSPATNNTTSVSNNTTSTNDSSSASSTYVASAKTDKFHRPDCEWAQQISGSNKITYSSRDQAIAAGKTPCSVCNP